MRLGLRGTVAVGFPGRKTTKFPVGTIMYTKQDTEGERGVGGYGLMSLLTPPLGAFHIPSFWIRIPSPANPLVFSVTVSFCLCFI